MWLDRSCCRAQTCDPLFNTLPGTLRCQGDALSPQPASSSSTSVSQKALGEPQRAELVALCSEFYVQVEIQSGHQPLLHTFHTELYSIWPVLDGRFSRRKVKLQWKEIIQYIVRVTKIYTNETTRLNWIKRQENCAHAHIHLIWLAQRNHKAWYDLGYQRHTGTSYILSG